MQRGSFHWMKTMNKSIVLNKIRADGPISRAQIAKETKLTPPTVGSIVKELLEQSLVKESVQGVSQGGRKPTMLVINHTEFYIIGIDVGPRDIEFILSDLSGKILNCFPLIVGTSVTKEQFLNQLKQGINQILKRFRKEKNKVIGIGVAMHGVVDVESGTSIYAPNLDLRDVPIKRVLEEEFNCIVKVENDARSLALGEVWFGNGRESESMIVVNIGRGIGAGIVIKGQLYHGEFNIAGEIGHMIIDLNGKKCECGNIGCLQTVASGPAIASKALEELKKGYKGLLSKIYHENGDELNGELIYKAALQGDKLSLDIFDQVAKYIGIGLTNLIHIINPSQIIISGGVSEASDLILDTIKSTIEESALTQNAKKTEVLVSNLGDHATSIGAVSLLLTELFDMDSDIA